MAVASPLPAVVVLLAEYGADVDDVGDAEIHSLPLRLILLPIDNGS